MKIKTLIILVTVLVLFVISSASSIVLAGENQTTNSSDIDLAKQAGEKFIKEICIDTFPEWNKSRLAEEMPLYNLENSQIGFVFAVVSNNKVLGKIVVGNSLYNYSILEADNGNPIAMPSDSDAKVALKDKLGLAADTVNKPKLYYLGVDRFYAVYNTNDNQAALDIQSKTPFLLSELTSSIATPEQYKAYYQDAANKSPNSLLLDSNYLLVPMRNMSDTCIPSAYRNRNCGPTSGAMIAEFWKNIWCPGFLNWCSDHNELYVKMQCNTWLPWQLGTAPWNFGPGFVQYASSHGYNFGTSYTLINDSYTDIRNQIDAGRPTGVMFSYNPQNPVNWHWNAIRGYRVYNGTNQIYTNDPWGYDRYVNWGAVAATSSIVRLWKNP
ncbi:MAG: C39 family peptidase [Dehalococcoidia bacterium]|nr:C39 family peptidase [Dehalococcoidia bacterium]